MAFGIRTSRLNHCAIRALFSAGEGVGTVGDLFDVLIEAQTELDWCADPSDLERALLRLVDLESRDDVAIPLQQKIAQLRMARELGRVTQH